MSNRKKRTKKSRTYDVDLKKQRKNLVPEKIRSKIMRSTNNAIPKSANPTARAVDQKNLRRGDR